MTSPSPLPRGARADAETAGRLYLVKPVSLLRATRQIRLLAARSLAEGKILILKVPPRCQFDPGLRDLVAGAPGAIQREDL